MHPEAAVGGDVDRQTVVVAHEHRDADARHEEARRDHPVEGPERLGKLLRHVRVEPHLDPGRGGLEAGDTVGAVVQATGTELREALGGVLVAVVLDAVPEAGVGAGPGLHGRVGLDRLELVVALVGPALA